MLGYLLGAAPQYEDKSGKPLVGGTIRVCLHGTTTPYITYRDFDGNVNPEDIVLNAAGMATIIASDSHVYDVYCKDQFGVDQWSRLNVKVGESGGGGGEEYYAGTGIDINDANEISVDQNVVALKNEIPAAQVNADWDAVSGVAQILNKPEIPPALSAGSGINITDNAISRRVQFVSTSHTYSYVRSIIDKGDLPVLDKANGSMHNYYVCTMMRGSDIQFVGSAYGQTTLYNLASNNTWTSQILEPQILANHAGKILAVNAAGTDAEWQAVRQVPTYAVADAGKLLQVVNNSGTMQLAWGQPTGYWTQSVSTSASHSVTADEAINGYFDEFISVTASDTASSITQPAYVAMTWDAQWPGGATSSRVSSIDFAIGVSGVSYKTLFTDSAPAHETHKDWGMTNAWILGSRYNSIRIRVNLTDASEGDTIQLYAGGIVTQVR